MVTVMAADMPPLSLAKLLRKWTREGLSVRLSNLADARKNFRAPEVSSHGG